MSKQYDLAIIGAGWAGFTAASKAKGYGLKVALIEKEEIGGTCLNRGCIPTKALIQSAKIYALAKKAPVFGVQFSSPEVDFLKIQERKDAIIRQLLSGMQFMLQGVDCFHSSAKLVSKNEVELNGESLKAGSILLATGSRPSELNTLKFDGNKIISSDGMLNLKSIPRSLLIIGGGVIGCEFASLFSALGSQVCIIEKMPQLLPEEDREVAKKLEGLFKKKNIKVNTNYDAAAVNLNDYELILLSVGRSPFSQGLGLEGIGVETQKGRIIVDEFLQTAIPNIYAAGDCTGKTMLAHFAAYQGRIAADNICKPDSRKAATNQNIPNCIFTDPEIASVGLTEEEARSAGLGVKISKFDFQGSGMARILEESEGFVKVISDEKSTEILGAAIIGPRATELVSVFGVAISSHLKVGHIQDTIFAHPTLSESIWEAVK